MRTNVIFFHALCKTIQSVLYNGQLTTHLSYILQTPFQDRGAPAIIPPPVCDTTFLS